jgi:transcriptional regulator with XRE-family HTH domain
MSELEIVEIEEDELESMRLCDNEGLTQEEAGGRMGVSRGTIQRLVTSGRAKMTGALLRNAALQVVPTRNHPGRGPEEEPFGFADTTGRRRRRGGQGACGRRRGRQ